MKSYIYNGTWMDIEELDSFINRFWGDIIHPLEHNQTVSVSFSLFYRNYIWLFKPMLLKNDHYSLHLLRSQILSGPMGSHLRMNENMADLKCYFQYAIL